MKLRPTELFSGCMVSAYLAFGLMVSVPTALLGQGPKSLTFTSAIINQFPSEAVYGVWGVSGVAIDPAGDIFIVDPYEAQVVKLPAGGGAMTTVGSGFNQPFSVAVDKAGNAFVLDIGAGTVVKVPADGSTQTTVISGLAGYGLGQFTVGSVALDAAGDVFASDFYNNRVVKAPAGGGAFTTVGTGLSNPSSVAVDAAGDVFIGNHGSGLVVEVPANGGPQTTIQTLPGISGLAVDGSGDLFTTQSLGSYSSSAVLEFPAGGGNPVPFGAGIWHWPTEVALDANGDIFVADQNEVDVLEFSTKQPTFGSVNVCPGTACAQTQTVTFNVNNNVTVGSISMLTSGAASADFTIASGSTCTGVLSASSTCTVNLTFTPQYAGVRKGAVEILDDSGNLLGSVYVQGVGVGSQVAFSPASASAVGTGLKVPQAVAFDGAGNAYIADKSLGVVKIAIGGSGELTSVGKGIGDAAGVATDGAGNVFIVDRANNEVVEVAAIGGAQTPVVTGLNSPTGLAIDGAGNLYVADTGNKRVLEVLSEGGGQVAFGSGFSAPKSVAVDVDGNVFVADAANNNVVEVATGGGSQSVVASGLSAPSGVALDAAGDLYVADSGNNRILEIPVGGGTPVVVAIGSALSDPLALGLDGAGDVFIADSGNSRVLELLSSQPLGLTFAAAAAATTSADSPKSVTVSNIGNAPLVITGISIGTNFTQVAAGGTPADCSATTSLTQGKSCNLSISFTPTGTGSSTSTAVLTDNVLGQNAATQSIILMGQALTTPTLNFPQIATQTGGTELTLSATTNSPSAVTFGSTTLAVCEVSGKVATLSASGGVCSLTASVAANSKYGAASVSQSFTVLAIPTLTFAKVASRTALGSATLSAATNSTSPVVFASTSPLVCKVSGSTVSFLMEGTCSLTASVATTIKYAAASTTQNIGVGLASQMISFKAISTQTAGTTVGLSAAASSGLPVTFSSVTAAVCAVSGSTATLIGGGSCSIVTSQAGNNIYAPTSTSQTFTVISKQTITFSAITAKLQGTSFALSATASSGLAVSFASLTPSVCTVSNSTVSLPKPGTCTIQASQAGNGAYPAAVAVTQSFAITPIFTITAAPRNERVLPGLLAVADVQIQSATNFNGLVTLRCSGGPAGSGCWVCPLQVHVVNGKGQALVSVYVPFTTPNGGYTETLTLTSGLLTDVGTFNFTVSY